MSSTEPNYKTLAKKLTKTFGHSRVITEPSLCFTLGTDASCYRLTPKIIVTVDSIKELKQVMGLCNDYKAPYTFRAAGTSLSGQAVSDSVLIKLTTSWTQYKILEEGNKITVQPGIIGADVNRYLAPYHKKIGPDPASINSCKIGGIAANNSSGMCCGTTENTYQTLSTMTVILADGTVLNTADLISTEQFKNSHSELLNELSALAEQTKADLQLSELIEYKYRLKNTMGFSINALIDYEDPIDILQHLMIGSEGCLGFIADITYNTVIESQHKASALLVYADIEVTCNAISAIEGLDVAAAELMDGLSLKSVEHADGSPEFFQHLDLEATALLLECHGSSAKDLSDIVKLVSDRLSSFETIEAVEFTTDTTICTQLWQVRKGLFPAVGALRRGGTSVIIEDISFPVHRLAEGTRALKVLFEEHGYDDAIVFGHALVGNLHFVISHDFNIAAEVKQYGQFMEALSHLVAIEFKGALKAEHGTGRNMAPFVELEWGTTAYQLMKKIKNLFDPTGIMNPGVVISDDQQAHINDLKIIPLADDIVDKCMECGFCEAVCPSRNLSLTPRQRIVMFRQLQQLYREKQTREVKQQIEFLTKEFDYLGIETCAATGLCEDRCPVGINTGDLILLLRQEKHQIDHVTNNRLAKWSANNFATTTGTLQTLLSMNSLVQKVIPDRAINSIGKTIHKLSNNMIPLWFPEYPTANKARLLPTLIADQKIVYVPSCSSRSLGTQVNAKDQRALSDVIIQLLEKAGYQVIIPDMISESCCGMPYHSQGMEDIAVQKSEQFETLLWESSNSGNYPILMDTSPCKKYSSENFKRSMDIYESSEFATKYLVHQLELSPLDETIMLYVTCSSRRMNLTDDIVNLANRCANDVIVVDEIQCCGWAGNKGFTTPELNESALSPLAKQVPADCQRGFSNSLTCEIGLSRHSGIPFQSILYLLDEVSSSQLK